MIKKGNQKLQIIALIVAIVGLGIGFAAFSNTLTISQSATVTPDSGNFKVVFTKTSGTEDTGAIVPTKSVNTLTATNGTIDQTNKLTLTNLGVTFTDPGQYVEYNLYVYNAGAYIAHLNSVTYRGTKSCTPANNTVNYVDQACQSISMTVKIGSTTTYSQTTQDITGQSLNPGASTPVKIRIEYASNGVRADGPFTVSFPDVSLYYVTVSGVNESYSSGFTGTIYRHTEDGISVGDSIASLTSGYETEATKGNITSPVYLKHIVENNIITASYACIKYTEGNQQKEACVQGGDPKYYGTFDGIENYTSDNYLADVSTLNPTGNIAVISSTLSYFKNNDDYNSMFQYFQSDVIDSLLYLSANSDGTVTAEDFDASEDCYVSDNGYSTCE